MVSTLGASDRIAIVVYAGEAGLVLPPTPASERVKILDALGRLEAGGSTNGGEGILLAYRTAREAFREGGVNRVILATDGDFNVGVSSEGDLVRLIEKEREGGVFLTVLGLGMGNYKDSTLEKLADKGNGNYAYLDTLSEARKVLIAQAGGTFVTIAKDVKIQVEFNPTYVSAYRLIGYENRLLDAQDFKDDKKDAGEIGAGHSVTALYELVPAGAPSPAMGVDPLKYQAPGSSTAAARSSELMTVKLRYKEPTGAESKLLSFSVDRAHASALSADFRFAAAVARFGMLLRDSKYRGSTSFEQVSRLAEGALGDDAHGYRHEFLSLVDTAKGLSPKATLAR
jgi:Ca-activated chloride channel family protein